MDKESVDIILNSSDEEIMRDAKERYENVDVEIAKTRKVIKDAVTVCAKHKSFPCRQCGTKHFEGCSCYFCRPH